MKYILNAIVAGITGAIVTVTVKMVIGDAESWSGVDAVIFNYLPMLCGVITIAGIFLLMTKIHH